MEYSFLAACLLFSFDINIYIFSWQINSAADDDDIVMSH